MKILDISVSVCDTTDSMCPTIGPESRGALGITQLDTSVSKPHSHTSPQLKI